MNNVYVHTDLHPLVIKDSIGWMVTGNNNMLFRIDMYTGKAEYVASLKDDENTWRGYFAADIIDNYVVCLPDRCDEVIAYDIVKGEQLTIKLPYRSKRWAFSSFIRKENEIIAYSRIENELVLIDLKMFTSTLAGKPEINRDEIYSDFAYEDRFYFVSGEDELVLHEYCISSGKLKSMTVCQNDGKYRMASFDGRNFWFSGIQKKLLVWNENDGIVKEISLKEYGICEYHFGAETEGARIISDENLFDRKLFMNHYTMGENIFFIPYSSSHIVYVDRISMKPGIVKIDNEEETSDTLNERDSLCTYKYGVEYIKSEGQMIVFSYKNCIDYCIDTRTGCLLDWKGSQEVVNENEYFSALAKKASVIYEMRNLPLRAFIQAVSSI